MRVRIDARHGAALEALRDRIAESTQKVLKVGIVGTHTYPGKKGRTGAALAVAEVAKFYEYGWVQRVTGRQAAYLNGVLGAIGEGGLKPGMTLYAPPRPFMRGTFAAHSKEWAELGANVFAQTLDVEKTLAFVGTQAVNDVRDALISGSAGGVEFPERSDLTMSLLRVESLGHRMDGTPATTATRKPGTNTGLLAHSIDYEITEPA